MAISTLVDQSWVLTHKSLSLANLLPLLLCNILNNCNDAWNSFFQIYLHLSTAKAAGLAIWMGKVKRCRKATLITAIPSLPPLTGLPPKRKCLNVSSNVSSQERWEAGGCCRWKGAERPLSLAPCPKSQFPLVFVFVLVFKFIFVFSASSMANRLVGHSHFPIFSYATSSTLHPRQ